MPIPSSVADLSTTPASNSPLGSDAIGVSLDDYLRSIQALIKQQDSKGADIASSSSITIPAVGKYFIVTGTTTITSIADSWTGRTVVLKFSGACQITRSTGLILPGAANITTAAGDCALVVNESTGVWRCVAYQPATGYQASLSAASQAEMESGTEAALRSMSPLRVGQAIAALAAAKPVPVRQTVLSGPVDTNGFAAFGGATGSTTVTASGTLRVTAANGFGANGQVDRVGSITNPSWTGLSTNGTMYLYLNIDAAGVCTTGSTTLEPAYRWGGADVTTNNQFTFNIQEMTGKVGNGATAAQTYRVFVGKVTVAGGVVTAIVWYALMGRYDSGYTATLPSAATLTSKNSNIGVVPSAKAVVQFRCTTADMGYAVGDVLDLQGANTGGVTPPIAVGMTSDTVFFTTGNTSGGIYFLNKSTGVGAIPTAASWSYKVVANRGW